MCRKPIIFSKIPKTALAALVITALYVAASLSARLANAIDSHICLPLRSAAALVTNLFPISIFEAFIISFLAIVVIVSYRRALLPSPTPISSVAVAILVALLTGYSLTLGIASNFQTSYPVREKIALSELSRAAEILADGVNSYTDEQKAEISELYTRLHGEIKSYASKQLHIKALVIPKAKKSLFSNFLQRMGTLAYYNFMTAETVYDGESPVELQIFNTVHETMHFLGVIREDEANFHAICLCMSSEIPCVRYAGTLAAYRYTASALFAENHDQYYAVYSGLSDSVKADIRGYNEFVGRYKDTAVRKLSDGANDAVIRARDARGSQSYSETARLIIDYVLRSEGTIIAVSE